MKDAEHTFSHAFLTPSIARAKVATEPQTLPLRGRQEQICQWTALFIFMKCKGGSPKEAHLKQLSEAWWGAGH